MTQNEGTAEPNADCQLDNADPTQQRMLLPGPVVLPRGPAPAAAPVSGGHTQGAVSEAACVDPKRGARIREADRSQITWGRIDLEAQLAGDHPARAIWAVVERLDLSALYAQIDARDGG